MSKVYQKYIKRMSREEIQRLNNKIKKIFNPYIKLSKIPELYTDKKDFGDLDFFCLLKPGITFNKEKIVEIFKNNGIEVKDIYKNDLEYTSLIKLNGKYYHVDLNILTNDKKGREEEFFNNFYQYFKKPFFGYFIGILLKKVQIKFTNKGIFYLSTFKENGYKDEYIKITNNLYLFLYELTLNFGINKSVSIKDYDNIKSYGELLNFLYSINFFNFNFYKFDQLNTNNKRKIRDYKINKNLQEKIIKDGINNIEKYYGKNKNKQDIREFIFKNFLIKSFPKFGILYGEKMKEFKIKSIFSKNKKYVLNNLFGEYKYILNWIMGSKNIKMKKNYSNLIKEIKKELDEKELDKIIEKYKDLFFMIYELDNIKLEKPLFLYIYDKNCEKKLGEKININNKTT